MSSDIYLQCNCSATRSQVLRGLEAVPHVTTDLGIDNLAWTRLILSQKKIVICDFSYINPIETGGKSTRNIAC